MKDTVTRRMRYTGHRLQAGLSPRLAIWNQGEAYAAEGATGEAYARDVGGLQNSCPVPART